MVDNTKRLGFMQGRLCQMVNGKIQAFPWRDWPLEFPEAGSLGITLMEWTLDHDRLRENPIMTGKGRADIKSLCRKYGLSIPSLTGDLFMQAPFYKTTGAEREALVRDFHDVLEACRALGVTYVVIPLVDGGGLQNREQEDVLVAELHNVQPELEQHGQSIIFESDYAPREYLRFLERLDTCAFGVNLDTGNSAALGFTPDQELPLYGDRVLNVHIKDRVRDGTTVPLGEGDADIAGTLAQLESGGYRGNYILQTARAADGDHAGAIKKYMDMTLAWLGKSSRE